MTDTSDPTKARTFTYARVSTKDQHRVGHGLDAQKDACASYITYRKLPQPMDAYIDDPISGSTRFIDRKAGLALHKILQRGDHLVFAKLDRAFRDTEDALYMNRMWTDMGVTIHFLDLNCDTSTPFGEFMLSVLASCAKLERLKISERVTDGLRAAKLQGARVGGRDHYGFIQIRDKDNPRKWHWYENLWERKIMEEIVYLNRERYSFEAIYWELKRRGYTREATGREWSARSVCTAALHQKAYEKDYPHLYADGPLPHADAKPGQRRPYDWTTAGDYLKGVWKWGDKKPKGE